MKNKKIDWLVFAGGLSNLFYSVAYPIVHTVTMQSINSNIMSLASLINCVITAIITKIWLSKSEKYYKYFGLLLFLEAITYSILTLLFIGNLATPKMYFIGDALLSALITRNIICCGTRLKAFRYNHKEREEFDNKTTYWCNITSIIGYGFSFLITLPMKIGFVCMLIGIVVDNIFYYYVWKKECNIQNNPSKTI